MCFWWSVIVVCLIKKVLFVFLVDGKNKETCYPFYIYDETITDLNIYS